MLFLFVLRLHTGNASSNKLPGIFLLLCVSLSGNIRNIWFSYEYPNYPSISGQSGINRLDHTLRTIDCTGVLLGYTGLYYHVVFHFTSIITVQQYGVWYSATDDGVFLSAGLFLRHPLYLRRHLINADPALPPKGNIVLHSGAYTHILRSIYIAQPTSFQLSNIMSI